MPRAQVMKQVDPRRRIKVTPNRNHSYVRLVLEDLILDQLVEGAAEREKIERDCERERGHNAINLAGADWSPTSRPGTLIVSRVVGFVIVATFILGIWIVS